MTKFEQQDLIEDWERELNKVRETKIKFPIIVSGDQSLNIDTCFNEPKINAPIEKKIEQNKNEIKILDLPKKRGSKDKPKLF